MIATLPSSLVLAIPLAIVAGLISFGSPCVLPLVPGYVAFMGGTIGTLDERHRSRAVVGAVSFVFGFAAVFVTEGALFGELGDQFRAHQRIIAIVLGSVTVLLGVLFAGWIPWRSFQREWRFHALPAATILGAVALGFLFGVGWTPCIGPTLASILAIAASSSGASAARGSVLAFFYCVGLGVPFLLFAVAGSWATSASTWMRQHQKAIRIIGGVMLIAIGIAEVTGWWQQWVVWLQLHEPNVSLPI